MRSSKDLAKRLPFRHFPRGDAFRRYYLWTVLGAVVVAVGVWLSMSSILGPRQYMPRRVSSVHATFSDRCENCHDSFQVVQDARCLQCHAVRVHSEHEEVTPPCRGCHVEHRDDRPLTQVASASCTECHAGLVSRRPGGAAIATAITAFADHPEFLSLRKEGAVDGGPQGHDPTRLRFNHKIHLTSSEITEPLECANCHQPMEDGRYMTTAAFERYAARVGEATAVWPAREDLSPDPFPGREGEVGDREGEVGDVGVVPPLIYCRECHAQNVKEIPAPFSEIEAPHARPEAIHASLVRDVLAVGVERSKTIFESDQIRLPGRVPRIAVDSESKTWGEFQDRWVGAIEEQLYHPLRVAPDGGSLFENNKYCFLCHEAGDDGEPEAAAIAPTSIPSRWLRHAEFSHRAHDKVECGECHGDLKQSAETADVNLPGRDLCVKCHRADEGRSAGTECVMCHLYHDTSKDPAKRAVPKAIGIGVLTGEEAPGSD